VLGRPDIDQSGPPTLPSWLYQQLPEVDSVSGGGAAKKGNAKQNALSKELGPLAPLANIGDYLNPQTPLFGDTFVSHYKQGKPVTEKNLPLWDRWVRIASSSTVYSTLANIPQLMPWFLGLEAFSQGRKGEDPLSKVQTIAQSTLPVLLGSYVGVPAAHFLADRYQQEQALKLYDLLTKDGMSPTRGELRPSFIDEVFEQCKKHHTFKENELLETAAKQFASKKNLLNASAVQTPADLLNELQNPKVGDFWTRRKYRKEFEEVQRSIRSFSQLKPKDFRQLKDSFLENATQFRKAFEQDGFKEAHNLLAKLGDYKTAIAGNPDLSEGAQKQILSALDSAYEALETTKRTTPKGNFFRLKLTPKALGKLDSIAHCPQELSDLQQTLTLLARDHKIPVRAEAILNNLTGDLQSFIQTHSDAGSGRYPLLQNWFQPTRQTERMKNLRFFTNRMAAISQQIPEEALGFLITQRSPGDVQHHRLKELSGQFSQLRTCLSRSQRPLTLALRYGAPAIGMVTGAFILGPVLAQKLNDGIKRFTNFWAPGKTPKESGGLKAPPNLQIPPLQSYVTTQPGNSQGYPYRPSPSL
jgi:hypothetical protein